MARRFHKTPAMKEEAMNTRRDFIEKAVMFTVVSLLAGITLLSGFKDDDEDKKVRVAMIHEL
jgi:hypothetical protein